MSLEGGEDYTTRDAVGACMGCGQRSGRLDGGHCSTCLGTPAPPEPSRREILEVRRETFEIACEKTRHPYHRKSYRAAIRKIDDELRALEARERSVAT